MTRTYYDEERNGDAIKVLDFVEFVNTSDAQKAETGRFYSYKLNYTATSLICFNFKEGILIMGFNYGVHRPRNERIQTSDSFIQFA